MKILWLSHLVPYPPKGGVLQRSHNLIKELAKYHEVHLISFIQKDMIESMFPDLETGLTEAKSELEKFCGSVELCPIPSELEKFGKYRLAIKSLFSRDSYTINWLKSRRFTELVKTSVRENTFDAIHVDTISLAPYIYLFPEAKMILDHHNVESHMMLRRAGTDNNWLRKLYYYQEGLKLQHYEKKICPQFDINVTCSDLDAERLSQIACDVHTVTIPNGVDTDYFISKNADKESNTMVFAGGLNWYPNAGAMQYFIDHIWSELKQKAPDAKMYLIGKHPKEKFIELSKNDENFVLCGFVDDVRPYIDRATVYVCPILEGGGTKLKILDALAMGAALVASPEACEGIDVTNEKNVLIAHSPNEYVAHILKLFADKNLGETLGNNGRILMEQGYSYHAIGKEFSSVIEKLAS
ncbi:MAG: glycosyltransferase [Gammaproteobacteria bacterium]|nr:glycosyltransferase [Gammaproteobacteria bacterium]